MSTFAPGGPFVKIFCSVLSSYCCYISFTPPKPPPSSAERAKYGEPSVVEDALQRFHFPVLFKSFAILVHVVEVVSILDQAWRHTGTSGPGSSKLSHPNISSASTLIPIIGLALHVFGTAIRVSAYRELGRHFTFELALRKDHKLVTSGVYAVVRHPSYIGLQLNFLGLVVCQVGPGSLWWAEATRRVTVVSAWVKYGLGGVYVGFVVCIGSIFVRRTYKEEMVLRGEFKEKWEAWAMNTRYKLVPYVF